MPLLTLHPATSQEKPFPWDGPRCDIGRADTNHLRLEDGSISSYHARIERRGDAFWLVDLNSTNGSFINDQRVREEQLREGDVIRLGEHVQIRFNIPTASAPARSPAGDAEVVVEMPPVTPVQPAQPVVVTMPPASPGTPSPSPSPSMPGAAQPMDSPPVPPGMAIQPIMPQTALAHQGIMCPACRGMVPFQVNFCPRCGFSLTQQAPLGFPMQQSVGFVRPMDQPGGMSIGLLPMLALLCGVLGFLILPAAVAIIMGLAALGQIRRLGGMDSDRRQAMWGISLGIFWLIMAVAGGGVYFGLQYRNNQQLAARQAEEQRLAAERERGVMVAKQIAANEADSITLLKGIARAQKLVKVARLKDPANTGKGQYMTLPELTQAGTSFVSRDLASGAAKGYQFAVLDAGEAGYLAMAEPAKYAETGKRTFTIDATGMVRGRDCEGQSFAQVNASLPVLSDEKSAFEGVDDAIAAEAIAHAKRLASEGKYEQCRQILDEIALKFAMTSAAQELAAIKKSVDPFIIEAQAQLKHQKATAAFAAHDVKLGIALLKEIDEIYPTYSRITAVKEELLAQQTALTQKLDKEAKELFDKAEAFERDGKPEAALDVYVQIEKNYPETEWSKRIIELRPALQKSIREKSAEGLFAQIRDLSITNEYRNIVNVIQQLNRNYADTDYVIANKDPIQNLFLKAQAEQYRALAADQMAAGKDADALARLEEACAANPDARVGFRDLFLKLYPRVGRKRMDEGDFREALRLYRCYLALEPAQSELDPSLLGKLQFALARSEFALGNYNNAAQLLIGARKEFEKDADYNDLFASVQVALGNYMDALPSYDKAIAAKPGAGNYYARRGYAQLLLALQTEKEAMIAYAGLLNGPAAKPAEPKPAKTDTNQLNVRITVDNPAPSNTPATASTGTTFEPVFATLLPPTATGVKPEMQIKYDALASQKLLDQVLDLLDGMTASNITARARKAIQTKKGNSKDTGDDPATDTGGVETISRTRDRIKRIKTSVDFGNALSSMRQRILDMNSRRNRSVEAMRRMSFYFTNGCRDLAKAVELAADRAQELTDILKAAQQHEKRTAQATPLITSYLATEIDVIEKVCQMTESVYQNLRVSHTSAPMDPTATLDIYFARYLDRRDFDQGIQILREAGAIKVPLETYSLIPATTAVPTPKPSAASSSSSTPPPAKPKPAKPSPSESTAPAE